MRCYEDVAGDGGLAAPLAVLIVILAVAAALYATPHSPPGGTTAATVTGTSSAAANTTTQGAVEASGSGGGESMEPTVPSGNETSSGRPCPLRALSLEAVEESGLVEFTVEASLPNPCYGVRVLNVTVDNATGVILVVVNLTEPGPGAFCIQRLQEAYLSFSVEASQLEPGRSYEVILLANPGTEAECKAPLGSYTRPGR